MGGFPLKALQGASLPSDSVLGLELLPRVLRSHDISQTTGTGGGGNDSDLNGALRAAQLGQVLQLVWDLLWL